MVHITSVKLKSKKLYMNTDITVLLPDSYGSEKKHKVLWLLHGAGNDDTEWLYDTNLVEYMNKRDVIVACPTALNSDYGIWNDFGKGYDFPAFFFDELMPFIWGFFSGSELPEDNYIAGLSMGGYGATALGLLHPERFGGIPGLGCAMRQYEDVEPYASMTGAEFRAFAMANRKLFRTEYGDDGQGIKPKEINVIAKYPTVQDFYDSFECMYRRFPEKLAEGKLPPMLYAVGTKDTFYAYMKRFEALAEDLGADNVEFCYPEGYGHNDAMWEFGLKLIIEHFKL